jgi:serine/threonine protein kinase
MGTPDYMAPEQVKGKRGDNRTDIYSLGAMLYEMTTGSTPFEGESPYVVMNARVTGDPVAPRKLNPNLTPVIEEIILHAVERDPANRYASAAEMMRELDNYESVELTNRFQRLRAPQISRGPRQLWLIIGIIVAVQVVLFFIAMIFLRTRH